MSNDKLQDEYSHFWRLLIGYLNQDYSIYGETLDDAVDACIADYDKQDLRAILDDINRFSLQFADDLDRQLINLTNDGHARDFDQPAADYLDWLRRRFTDALA